MGETQKNQTQKSTRSADNLVPLDRNKNSSASNYDFAKKKDVVLQGQGHCVPPSS